MTNEKVEILFGLEAAHQAVFILALCLVVSMLLSVYNMFHISRAYDRELYGALSNFLSLSVTEIGYKLDNVQQMTTDLGQDSQIQTYLSHNKDASRAFSSEYNALYYLVQDYYKKNRVNCVSNITLYTGNFTLRSNTSANVYVPDEVYKDLYEAALGANGATVCVTDYSRDYGLFFVKAIRRIENLRLDTLGIEVVQVDLEKLVKSSVSLNQYDNVIFVLTRPQDGAVMYSSAGEAGPQTLPTLDTESRWDICKLDSVKYFVTADGSADYPWDYLCLVPYNEIYASIRDALLFCILFFLAGIALTFLVCHFLVDRITRRFAKLISQMDQFAKYTPDMVLPVDEFSGEEREAGDEVGMLSRHFSHMAREIDGLIQTDYTNRILLREAQLRRVQKFSAPPERRQFVCGDLVLDREEFSVTAGGEPVVLTAREFEILALLMEYPKRVFTREQIYQHVWGEEYFGDDNTVNVHISNLRAKLGRVSDREYIKTVWGIGFKMAEP